MLSSGFDERIRYYSPPKSQLSNFIELFRQFPLIVRSLSLGALNFGISQISLFDRSSSYSWLYSIFSNELTSVIQFSVK